MDWNLHFTRSKWLDKLLEENPWKVIKHKDTTCGWRSHKVANCRKLEEYKYVWFLPSLPFAKHLQLAESRTVVFSLIKHGYFMIFKYLQLFISFCLHLFPFPQTLSLTTFVVVVFSFLFLLLIAHSAKQLLKSFILLSC